MKQLRRYATFDIAQPWEMADGERHAFWVCEIRRPNRFLALVLPAHATSSFTGLDDESLEELPCHPPVRKYTALEAALANAVPDVSVKVFEASSEVAVSTRELRSNMGR